MLLRNNLYILFIIIIILLLLIILLCICLGIKPFAELSIVQLLMGNSQIKQFKYFKVLVQEFHIKVDIGFINTLVDCLQSSESSENEEVCILLFLYLINVVTTKLDTRPTCTDLLHPMFRIENSDLRLSVIERVNVDQYFFETV